MSVSILVVDDEADVAEMFRQRFRREMRQGTYVLHFALSAEEALQKLKDEIEPQLIVILSDINMPGMDGKSCLKEIRKEKKFDSVNVVIYSTNCFPKDIEQIESLGAVFIRKANSFSDLCAMVKTLVTKSRP